MTSKISWSAMERSLLLEPEPAPERDRPPPADAEPIPDGELARVPTHRPRRTEPQRDSGVTAEPRPFIRIPGAPVVHERRETEAHHPPQVVSDDDPVFEREPRHARP